MKYAFLVLNKDAVTLGLEVNEQKINVMVVERGRQDHSASSVFGKYQFSSHLNIQISL